MDVLVTLLVKLSLHIAVYVLGIRIVSGFVPPSRLSNRSLGRAISLIFSIIAAKKYVVLLEEFVTFSEGFRLVVFFIALIGNLAIAFMIFSTKNIREEKIIYNAGPKPTPPKSATTKPTAKTTTTTRPGQPRR